jgi:hypothetical protein
VSESKLSESPAEEIKTNSYKIFSYFLFYSYLQPSKNKASYAKKQNGYAILFLKP